MRHIQFFLLFVLIAFSACKKTTVCTGVVYDGGTGLPLEGASVGLSTYDSYSSDVTDPSGRYSVSLEVDKDEKVSVSSGKSFYIPSKAQVLENGSSNEIDFTIYGYDSDLEITFVNDSTPSGRVYVYFNGPLYNGNSFTPDGDGAQLVPYQTTLVKRFKVVGGQGVWVNWDTDLIGKFNRDTVYCQNRETTSWTIRF